MSLGYGGQFPGLVRVYGFIRVGNKNRHGFLEILRSGPVSRSGLWAKGYRGSPGANPGGRAGKVHERSSQYESRGHVGA
jgi:hypothetical protein